MDARTIGPSKIGALRELLFSLLQEHERDDTIPTNARFLYYELVQRGQLSKERTGARRPDQNLHDALTDIREDGRIPWDWIVDETRSLDDYTGYRSIKEGVLAQLPYIELDPWRGRAPMNLTESRSLAGVLRDIVAEYRARISSTNGQCGGHLRTRVAPELRPGDRVLYLGDFDLSGGQIEDNTRRVLEREIGGPLHASRRARKISISTRWLIASVSTASCGRPSLKRRSRLMMTGRSYCSTCSRVSASRWPVSQGR
jgi:hypothetical protein